MKLLSIQLDTLGISVSVSVCLKTQRPSHTHTHTHKTTIINLKKNRETFTSFDIELNTHTQIHKLIEHTTSQNTFCFKTSRFRLLRLNKLKLDLFVCCLHWCAIRDTERILWSTVLVTLANDRSISTFEHIFEWLSMRIKVYGCGSEDDLYGENCAVLTYDKSQICYHKYRITFVLVLVLYRVIVYIKQNWWMQIATNHSDLNY